LSRVCSRRDARQRRGNVRTASGSSTPQANEAIIALKDAVQKERSARHTPLVRESRNSLFGSVPGRDPSPVVKGELECRLLIDEDLARDGVSEWADHDQVDSQPCPAPQQPPVLLEQAPRDELSQRAAEGYGLFMSPIGSAASVSGGLARRHAPATPAMGPGDPLVDVLAASELTVPLTG